LSAKSVVGRLACIPCPRTKDIAVDIGQIVTSAISSIIGVFLAGALISWQHARAERHSSEGRPVNVPASIRSVGGRFAMWRHGTVTIHRDQVVWTPRMPWGRELVLAGVGYGDQRTPLGPQRFLLPSAAVVVSCMNADKRYELAVLPRSVKFLFWALA
jgi:hypothetical protein